MKVTISINDELMERIDNYADDNFMSRSGFITFACNEYLKQQEVFKLVRQMSYTMNLIAEKGEVDAEVLAQLEQYNQVMNLILGQ